MAYTSVIPVRRLDRAVKYVINKEKTTAVSLQDALDYAANRDKTEQSCFESSYACTLETAFADMRQTKERWHKSGGVQGYHLVQSFAAGEVTPELAHRIAKELADRVLGGRYEYIIGTHLNTGHIHSHIVWNSVSRIDGKKYHSNGKSYVTEIRAVSDELCRKYMLYLLHEAPPEEQNFSMVMEMIAAAEVHEDDDNYQSPLDILFERLEMREPDSIACKQYRIFKQAAGKTAKSILVSVGVRLAAFNLSSIAKLTMTDELHLQELGERKIALFCCIPDSDKSLNYLVGMIYTQLIQTLYRQADRVHKGRLPVPVHCLMDEYANISLPKDTFLSALATMRSRAIFCSIIVQNMAQLKAMYKDDWESLVGLCDEFLYLGGTEKETHKYVSELLGKETISTTSYNQSKGRSGSYSINRQQSGRDLMTPDEVRLLDNSKCILFIRGERPVVDYKYNLLKHPNIRYTEDGGAASYDYTAADNALDDLPGAPENYELLDMDDFLPAEAAEMKPTIQRIRRST